MTGSCQKTEAVARLEISCWQRQLPELKKIGADHFSRLSGSLLYLAQGTNIRFCTIHVNLKYLLKLSKVVI